MRKIVYLFLFFPGLLLAQTDPQELVQARELLYNGQYNQVIRLIEPLTISQGYENRFHSLTSMAYLGLKQATTAEKFANQSYMVNQTHYAAYLAKCLVALNKGDQANALKWIKETVFFATPKDYETIKKDINWLKSQSDNTTDFNEILAEIDRQIASSTGNYKRVEDKITAMSATIATDPKKAIQLLEEAIALSGKLPSEKRWLQVYCRILGGVYFYYNQAYATSSELLAQAFSEIGPYSDVITPYIQAYMTIFRAEMALNAGNLDTADPLLTISARHLSLLGNYANDIRAKHLATLGSFQQQKGLTDLLKITARELINIRYSGYDDYYHILGNQYMGSAYLNNISPESRKRAKKYLETANQMASKPGFENLLRDIQGNLALVYWQSGEQQRARTLYQKLIKTDIDDENYSNAEVSLNNLAYLHMYQNQFSQAAGYFKQAIDLTETIRRKLPIQDRIAFFEGKISSYKGYIYCLAKQNLVEEVFNAQQKDRARVLTETLYSGQEATDVSLAEYQALLPSGKVAVFYTNFEAAVVVITTVTHTTASVTVADNQSDFIKIKAQYLDQLYRNTPGYQVVDVRQSDYANYKDYVGSQLNGDNWSRMAEMLKGLISKSIETPADLRTKIIDQTLAAYHKLLIQPVGTELSGNSHIIFYPDGVLNFIPFEALKKTSGRYLLQQFQVSYGSSAGVSKVISKRQYNTDRKAFFAMGGANYGRMNEKDKVASQPDFSLLKLQTEANATAGTSQRMVMASLFADDKMKPLPGTLTEVNTLGKIFNDADIFTGNDMTESNIKQMSANGTLANYKIIHLATHGFALGEFPALSGVAMTIFPTEQNGEDGYLIAPEISKLKMNADMVVLSACETALGKIYGGEGVAGLVQALLIGGSNSALVSLWPVNDAGTMYFMTGLYSEVQQQGKDYAAAVNSMKKRFINGEFGESFTDISIWAPFIYYAN